MAPYARVISDILVDPTDKHRFWVSFSGFGGEKVAEYYQGNWIPRSTGLPDVPAHCLALDTSNGTFYVGTNIGVFYQDDSTTQWMPFQKNLPSIEVTDLAIQYQNEEIWASTYGRGLWKSPKQGSVPAADTSQDTTNRISSLIPYAIPAFYLSPNPSDGNFWLVAEDAEWKNQTLRGQIVDMEGKTLWEQELRLDARGRARINASGLSTGVYTLLLHRGQEKAGFLRLIVGRK